MTRLNVKANNAQQNTKLKNETIFESNETHDITFKNDSFHSIRNRIRSISFFEFQFSLNNLKRALRFGETRVLSKRIIYFSMFQYASHNTHNIQTQNQTASDVTTNDDKAFELNLNYENFEKNAKNFKTLFIRVIMSSSLIHDKKKQKTIRIFKTNKRVTINLTFDNIEAYRCIFKNITRELIQKFNFVIEKDFFKFVQKDQRNLFEIIKRLLVAYQIMNEASREMQRNLTVTNDDKKQFEIRMKIQKQKITNISKKKQNVNVRITKFESFITIKKSEIAKLRKTKNVHKNNFEKINVKIKILIIDKQILKKIIQNFERKLRNIKIDITVENFDEKSSNFRQKTKQRQHTFSNITTRRIIIEIRK